MTTNVIPISQPNDPDAFIRLCNSPAQRARRMQRRKTHQRQTRKVTVARYTGLITAGATLGIILTAII